MRIAILLSLMVPSLAQSADVGPWNLDNLRKPPKVEWLDKEREWFLTATDQRKATVCTEHVLQEK